MRAFLHVFLGLLIPVSLIVAILLTLFFTMDYSFTQAMSLGVLYGLFSGIVVTLILSSTLTLLRVGKKKLQTRVDATQKENVTKETEELSPTESSPDTDININKGMEHKLMLLMNKELTFGIILTMIKKQIAHSITKHNIDKGNINIKIHGEIISISITTLTKHTSQVKINGINNSKHIQNIVSFLKEKEHSFLQY